MYSVVLLAFVCGGGEFDDVVAQLGHNQFSIRKKAHIHFLENMDFASYVKLRDFKTADQEITTRKRAITAAFVEKAHKKLRARYKPDLMGYPKYPWIFWGSAFEVFPTNYQWRSLDRTEISYKYRNAAANLGAPMHNSPDYTGWRIATELWAIDWKDLDLRDAIPLAKCESDVDEKMQACMGNINKVLGGLTAGEDHWWQARGTPNPLRVKGKKDP